MDVAVLGAGTDGRDIASLCARQGHAVSLQDDDATTAMNRIDDIERAIVDAATSGEITEETKTEAVDGLEATTSLDSVIAGADAVLETVTTDMEGVQAQFAEIEPIVERDTLLVTTVPTVSVTTAAAGLRQPDRALGFNFIELPEPSVIEILIADQTAQGPTERAESFVESLGIPPVRVRDAPGIASTRLDLALELEAMRAVEDGVTSVEGVDTLLRRGTQLPEGPLERADRAGLDRRLATLETLASTVGPRFEPPEILARLVENGATGSKSGEGFYRWESGEPVESAVAPPELADSSGHPDDPAHR